MSESKKLLIGFGVVGVLCFCIAGISLLGFREFGKRIETMASGEPTSIARAQEKIADFDVPPGYQPMAMSMLMYDTVYLIPADEYENLPMILLMQYGGLSSGNSEQVAEQLKQAAEQQSRQPGVSMKVVDTFEDVIRGQPVTVTVSESSYQGFTLRQWMTVFQGKNGPVVLMIQGSAATWDDQLLDDFVESIK